MEPNLFTTKFASDAEIIIARQAARDVAALLGFDSQDQSRIATCVSEIVRNACKYAGSGIAEFSLCTRSPQALIITIIDQGPGIRELQQVLAPLLLAPAPQTGIGIRSARRLADRFDIQSSPDKGTIVRIEKNFASKMKPLSDADVANVRRQMAARRQTDQVSEMERVNSELLTALGEMQRRQEELERLNKELDDTNRGVLALYAELDERADFLRRVSDLKSHFLSNMSHEFRTPLNSILSLSRILLDRMDGELSGEQEKQVVYIRRAAQSLLELVNDLLDLAKVEAGKLTIRPSRFEVTELFSALRGMLRPLQTNPSVELIIDEPPELRTLFTDEGKVSQILRNLIDNALKFTEQGAVRVSIRFVDGEAVFCVKDTGIGIPQADQHNIFEEFIQVENPLQKRTKGTGLGLPLSRKLAQLLGGDLTVESEEGMGSTFYARIPLTYDAGVEQDVIPVALDPERRPVLVIEDNEETALVYEAFLRNTPFQMIPVKTIQQAHDAIRRFVPFAILLDIRLENDTAWGLLAELKRNPAIRHTPVYVVTIMEERERAQALGATDFTRKPMDRDWFIERLQAHLKQQGDLVVLLIDDDEAARYVAKNQLRQIGPIRFIEATDGADGFDIARREKPGLIILDLVMDGIDGFKTLHMLRADKDTEDIPVIVYTSKSLTEDQKHLLDSAIAILPKTPQAREEMLQAAQSALRLGRQKVAGL